MSRRIQEEIMEELSANLKPSVLEITDDSEKHAGHRGTNKKGETHFSIVIVSSEFNGKTQVQRHRRVYELLKGPFERGLHALQLKTWTEEEYRP